MDRRPRYRPRRDVPGFTQVGRDQRRRDPRWRRNPEHHLLLMSVVPPRQFCQTQLLMLGDEELLPTAQAATLEILHSTVMKDPDGPTFEARLRVLASASHADGRTVGAASQVAQVLLDAWQEAQAED